MKQLQNGPLIIECPLRCVKPKQHSLQTDHEAGCAEFKFWYVTLHGWTICPLRGCAEKPLQCCILRHHGMQRRIFQTGLQPKHSLVLYYATLTHFHRLFHVLFEKCAYLFFPVFQSGSEMGAVYASGGQGSRPTDKEIRIDASATTPKQLKESYTPHHIIAERKSILVDRDQMKECGFGLSLFAVKQNK